MLFYTEGFRKGLRLDSGVDVDCDGGNANGSVGGGGHRVQMVREQSLRLTKKVCRLNMDHTWWHLTICGLFESQFYAFFLQICVFSINKEFGVIVNNRVAGKSENIHIFMYIHIHMYMYIHINTFIH